MSLTIVLRRIKGMKFRIDKLDALFSEFIRRRAILRTGGCERCLSLKYDIQKDNGSIFPAWKQLDCAHLISRWHKSIRWDEDAALGLCGGCHLWIDHEAEEKLELLKSKIGEEGYEMLQHRSRQIGKPDEAAIELYLQVKIQEVEDA